MKERERAGEGQRKRETKNPKQAPCCQHWARCGAQSHKPQDHDLSQNQESEAQPTERPRCPNIFPLLKKSSRRTCVAQSIKLRSWSRRSWVRAPCQALCWQLRACSLLWILCLPLSLSLSCLCALSLSFSLPVSLHPLFIYHLDLPFFAGWVSVGILLQSLAMFFTTVP